MVLMKPYILTGAGVSLASGIPTFRGSDPDAVWSNRAVETGTRQYFLANPVESWSYYLDRFLSYTNCEPNKSHVLLSKLEEKSESFTLVTQNVDGLHSKAGNKDVIEIHGAMRYLRCSKWPCKNAAPLGIIDFNPSDFDAFLANPSLETIPKCSLCGEILRPHVLWFDESYDSHHSFRFTEAVSRVDESDIVIALGTSLQVGIAKYIRDATRWAGIPFVLIDPFLDKPPLQVVKLINQTADEFLESFIETGEILGKKYL
jgi:NAD-dependent deacetylase